MSNYTDWHSTVFKVRDYECDLQGRVNNSVYGNYFEHARHEALLSKGIDFAHLCEHNIHLVVTRAEIDYRKSLGSGDVFVVYTEISLQGRLKIIFQQQLLLNNNSASSSTESNIICASAKVTGVAVNERGRPFVPDFFAKL